MTQFETQVPEPLGDDLPALLARCRMADPAVWVLFLVFISQRRGTRPTMQIQRHDITSHERALGELCHKQFVDHTQTGDPDPTLGGLMRCYDEPTPHAIRSQRQIRAVIERAHHPAFGMGQVLIGGGSFRRAWTSARFTS